jgi:hypothetical protein
MPYSNFQEFKGRPILVFREIDKNDLLVLPLTTNLKREGIIITNSDIKKCKKPTKSDTIADPDRTVVLF